MNADRELRSRQSAYLDEADRLVGPSPSGGGSIVVITVAVTSYPTATGQYYGCKQVDVGGAETEGTAAVYTTVGDTFYVLVLTGTPVVGTRLIADPVGGRWVVAS